MGRMKELWQAQRDCEEDYGFTDLQEGPCPWQEFQVGEPGTGRYSRLEFSAVYHVTHTQHAVRIIEDQKIRADLVKDESKLNKTRTRVVWFSPNDWKNGFLYGNIRFQVPWGGLIAGKRYYWVESIAYKTKACRILISDKEHPDLDLYDPSAGDGPWVVRDERHYFNGDYTFEVLIDGDIPLAQVEKIDFVNHHDTWCALRIVGCNSIPAQWAGAVFLATLLSRGLDITLPGFIRELQGERRPIFEVYQAIKELRKFYQQIPCTEWGALQSDHPTASTVVRAVVSANIEADWKILLSMFVDFSNFGAAFDTVVAEALGLSGPTSLHNYWR